MKNKILRLKQGYDINISDDCSEEIVEIGVPETVAVKPVDFEGLKLKPVVEINTNVRTGEVLGFDKTNKAIKLTAPFSGRVVAINRGERRVITEIVIKTNEKVGSVSFQIPTGMTREKILELLMESGLFLLLKQRPFNVTANPDRVPRDIFISATDTSPMAPDLELILKGNEEAFQTGLSILSQLTSGKLHVSAATPKGAAFESFRDVDFHLFEGKHPAGNVGVQIHHLQPVLSREDVVWTIGVQGVILIGKLFTRGQIDPQILVKVSGPAAVEKKYFRTCLGATVSGFVKSEDNARIISGNILTGRQISPDGFVGYFDNLVSIIPEAAGYEFFGWIAPGLKKLSISRSFLSTLLHVRKPFGLTTRKHGSERAFVVSGLYEKYLPMDIFPVHLMKSIIIGDIEEMEQLGIYEVVEEDVALLEYICPSKIEWQENLRQGIRLILKEG
ncbi:MAG: Na(+)-translocating NADH-quinone reductase subunit A [Candidatus Marinimicrobia bacterium]|nr:Na(+)-translocating NADH-quinone reductase subunit A [Candidatus Neomarinimicrobiota bacterium]